MLWIKKSEKKTDRIEKIDELRILRENDRIKLHLRYISGILAMIIVWLITTGTASDANFPSWISFSSTITSIILSVLAIILSITGEGKTEKIKEQLEDTAKKINESQEKVNEINDCIENNLSRLNEEIKKLSDRIEEVPQKTAQRVTEYKNKRMYNPPTKESKKINGEWENQKR